MTSEPTIEEINGASARRPSPALRAAADPDRHRMLPASTDAEQGIVCSLLLAPGGVGDMCELRGVTPALFHSPALATIYRELMAMRGKRDPIDPVTLTQRLYDRTLLDQVGGAAFISALFTFLPTASNASFYIATIEDKAMLRETIAVCTEFATRAYEDQDDCDGLMEAHEKRVLAIRPRPRTQTGYSGSEIARMGIDGLQARIYAGGKISGLSTGFRELDLKTDGMHPTELIVLAARPSDGKSALAGQVAEFHAVDGIIPAGIISLEMGSQLLSERAVASRARVNTMRWRYGQMPTDEQCERIRQAADDFARSSLRFEELSDATIQQLRAAARRMVSEFGVKIIVVDSLSALRSDSGQARSNREREVSEAVIGCKEMAKELKIVVILIVHLHRRVEEKREKGGKASLADLRESGSIEQTADSAWILAEEFDEHGEYSHHSIRILKQRGGARGEECRLMFIREFCRFEDMATAEESEQLPLIDTPKTANKRKRNQGPDDL